MIDMKKRSVSVEKAEWDMEPDASALEQAAMLDYPDAEVAYLSLIERGSTLSMINLASHYERHASEHGSADFSRAEFWYRKAVDAGSAVSTLPCGCFYLRRQEYSIAANMFELGVDRDYPPAMVRLAHLYANGRGVERNEEKAEHLLMRAARMGNIWGKVGLATMYMNADKDRVTVAKGLCLICSAAVQLRWERWRRPWSEKLKK